MAARREQSSWPSCSGRSRARRWRCSMAPASGEETRRVLAEKAREGRERATEAARQGREFVNRQQGHALVGDRTRPRGLRAGARGRHASGDRRRRGSVTNGWSDLFLGVIAVGDAGDGADPGRRDHRGAAAGAAGAAGDPVGPAGRPAAHRARATRSPMKRRARSRSRRRRRRKSIGWSRDLSRRVDETAGVVQEAIITPRAKGWRLSPPSRPAWPRCAASRAAPAQRPSRRRGRSPVHRLTKHGLYRRSPAVLQRGHHILRR